MVNVIRVSGNPKNDLHCSFLYKLSIFLREVWDALLQIGHMINSGMAGREHYTVLHATVFYSKFQCFGMSNEAKLRNSKINVWKLHV